jgi:hypothetical protein
MPRVRVSIEISRGRIGVPLQKLGEIVRETETFLKMLAEDVELPGDKRQWLGLDFQSGSLKFVAEYATPVEPRQFSEFSSSFDDVRRGRLGRARSSTRIQRQTIPYQNFFRSQSGISLLLSVTFNSLLNPKGAFRE